MYIYICNNQIAGYTNDPAQTPSGFEVYEYQEETSIESLYFEAKRKVILKKPPKSSESAYWDDDKHCWVETQPMQAIAEELLTDSSEFKGCMVLIKDYPDLMLNLVLALYADAKSHPDKGKFRSILKQRVESAQKQQAKATQSSNPQTTSTTIPVTTTSTTTATLGLK